MRYTTRIIVPPRVRRSGLPGSLGVGPRPQAIGVRRSLGLSDPWGVAAAANVALATAHVELAPFLVQQVSAEVSPGLSSPLAALSAASRAVANARLRGPWGADADRLQTPQDVETAAAAGYTYFTIDLAGFVRAEAVGMSTDELARAVERLIADGELPEDWSSAYLDRTIDLPGGHHLELTLDPLRRAAVRFGRAVQHAARMSEAISRANQGRPYEIEVSLDANDVPLDPAEHLFLGLELEARHVRLTGLALPIDGSLGTGAWEASLRRHAAVASFCGPYKLSFRFSNCPADFVAAIGRSCGDAFHLKSSGESAQEALRLAARLAPALCQEIAGDAIATDEAIFNNPAAAHALTERATAFLAIDAGAKSALLELIERHADIYRELLLERYAGLLAPLEETPT